MAFLIGGANSAADTGYDVANSCRFNSGDDCKISRTSPNSSPTDIDKFTFSCWVKRSTLGANQQIFDTYDGSSGGQFQIYFKDDDTLRVQVWNSSTQAEFIPTRLFRDVSAWYSIIFAYDSSPSTPSSSSVKLFINGTQETAFNTETYPSQNTDGEFAIQNHIQMIGNNAGNSTDFGGYLAEVIGVDGQALAHTEFGEFDEDSPKIWKPIDISGINVGVLGFYCDFEDSGTLGNDVSGVGDFTLANLAAGDQTVDTPTNNFPTLNPLVPLGTFSEGNTVWGSVASGDGCAFSTIGVASGKWYAEVKCTGAQTSGFGVGVVPMQLMTGSASGGGTSTIGGVEYIDARVLSNGSDATSSITGISQNDIIGIALNMDDAEVKFYLNNTVQEGGTTIDLPSGGFWCFSTSDYHSTAATEASMNFGNPAYSLTSAANDANGYGNFEFAPPDGYLALCTKNLGSDGG